MNTERLSFLGAVFLAVAGIAFVSVAGFSRAVPDKPYAVSRATAPAPPAVKTRSREEIASACREHIAAAGAAAERAAARRAEEFATFLRDRRTGARPFAEAVTSWYGKWRVVKPWLPFADDDGHKQYVAELFARHLFSNAELARALQRSIEHAVRDIETIQNELALKLREEITADAAPTLDGQLVADEFRQSIEQIVAASQWDAQKAAGSLVVSEVVSTIGTQVLVRLGVSAGILGAGAANSWWSFGGSLVIGLAVDLIWEWIDDPVGDVERETAAAITKLAANSGRILNQELRKTIQQKQELWLQASERLLADVR